jgi:hypothetical protein
MIKVLIIFGLQNLIIMKKYFLLLLVTYYYQTSYGQKHTLSDCQLEVWKGRKTNDKITKIAFYTGKDFKNPAIEPHDSVSVTQKQWERRKDGVWCLSDSMETLKQIVYRVKDTTACKAFIVKYHVWLRKPLVKGKLKKVEGICENKITPNLIAGLNQKLLDDKILDELPDTNIPNWPHVYYIAIRQYQEKYGLHVGLLTLETVQHMKLTF